MWKQSIPGAPDQAIRGYAPGALPLARLGRKNGVARAWWESTLVVPLSMQHILWMLFLKQVLVIAPYDARASQPVMQELPVAIKCGPGEPGTCEPDREVCEHVTQCGPAHRYGTAIGTLQSQLPRLHGQGLASSVPTPDKIQP